jgi:trehalose 6-phosphate phosphatase
VKDILSRAGRAALEEIAQSNVLLGFDYDGTLAPIVARPERARMRPSSEMLLAELTRRYPCAVISGRGRSDVLDRLGGLPLLRVVGNHGLEWETPAPHVPRETIVRWRNAMARACGGIEGVEIEDKTWSVAVHWRRARPKSVARSRVLAAAEALKSARMLHGKDVVNLVHPSAANKGAAILEIRRQLGCDTILYIGDDVTDEDVFELGAEGRILTIRVRRRAASRALYYLRSQAQIDDLLTMLLAFRPSARRLAAR